MQDYLYPYKNRRLLTHTVILGVCVFAFSSVEAQPLDEVLRLVYETNPDIRAERARQEATTQSIAQARAGALPQIAGEASYARTRNDQVVNQDVFDQTALEERRFDLRPAAASINGEQVVFDGFRNLNAIRQARARVGAGDAQMRAVEQDILLQAATAYFDVLRDKEIYDANLANADVLRGQLKQAEARFRHGEITKTDVRQAEARLAGARAEVTTAQGRLTVSRTRYRQIVGEAPGVFDDETPPPETPETEEIALAFARELAPSILNVRAQEEASRRQVAIEKAAFSPTVSLTASYQYSEETSSFIDRDEQFSYGLRARIPIFNGGLRLARTKEAKALNRRDKSLIISAERQVEAQVSSAWAGLVEARMRIRSADVEVSANKAALKGVRREARYGARTTLDVLNAEQELLSATTNLAVAKRDERVAVFELLRAMGVIGVNIPTH